MEQTGDLFIAETHIYDFSSVALSVNKSPNHIIFFQITRCRSCTQGHDFDIWSNTADADVIILNGSNNAGDFGAVSSGKLIHGIRIGIQIIAPVGKARCVRKIPSVHIIHIAVPIIIHSGLAVQFGLIVPNIGRQIRV